MFTYQKTNRYFAQTGDGFEDLASNEIEKLGGEDVKKAYRGIYFQADKKTLYRINYRSQLCTRITAPLLQFDCHSTKYLYKTAIKLPWQDLLKKNGNFIISATTSNSKLKHSQYAAQCLKDAIVDQFRDAFGERPSVSKENPDLWLDLHIDKNKALISLDTSGGSLHKRGYRVESTEAPMQESLAAAIISLTEWDGNQPLVDPMCGSGTLLSEALIHYCQIPASFNRKRFGFMAMPDYDADVWKKVKREEDEKEIPLPKGLIRGSDISGQAIKAARKNLKILPSGSSVDLMVKSYQELGEIRDAVIVCNPPFGIRLQKRDDIGLFMEDFGNFLKRKCTNSTAYLYLGKRELLKKVGLRPAWKKPLMSGGLDGVLAKYELY